jgi:two-component system sensor histidine kinase UhpB
MLADGQLHHPDVRLTLDMPEPLDGLDDALATAVYRILQEAMSNALRHAQAQHIGVRVQALASVLHVEVVDDGVGRVGQWQTAGRYGVLGMRERAQALGGTCDLDQMVPAGVRVRVSLPLKMKQPVGA